MKHRSRYPFAWAGPGVLGLLLGSNAGLQSAAQQAHAVPHRTRTETRLDEVTSPRPSEPQASAPRATLPNGRDITPAGLWVPTAPYPFTLAVRPDGRQLAIPSVGWPFSLNVLDVQSGRRRLFRLRSRRQIPPGHKNEPTVEVINGVVYSPDGKLLYVSTGNSGAVDVYATDDWHKVKRITLDGTTEGQSYHRSFSGALARSPDGRFLYVLDEANWRVAVIDTEAGGVVASMLTGANPFALALSPDGRRVYVANSGLFEYKRIPGVDKKTVLQTGLHFPPFGYPSRAAREGARVEGHAVPGLGPENDPRGSSVWTYSVQSPASPQLRARLRLGAAIDGDPKPGSSPVVGGAAPMGVAADAQGVYVSLAHEDAVAVLSPEGDRQLAEIALTPFAGQPFAGQRFAGQRFHDRQGRPLRGVMPAGLALHGERLYVTEAGLDAVAVIDTRWRRVLGHMPVGWYPSAVGISADGTELLVVNTKGRGAGPNGGAAFYPDGTGSYIGEREFGSLSVLPLGEVQDLHQATAQVVQNNTAALLAGAVVPRLQHVFLIIRENRTFDEMFGDLPQADGDPSLARWGMHGWTRAAPGEKNIPVTPNAHALAARFATSDRFFVDSDVSADGHRWMVGAAETPWFHLAWTSSYGGRRSSDPDAAEPGRRALGGGPDAPMPEDEPQFGTLWEHIADAGLPLRNYGEGLEIEGAQEMDGAAPEGQRLLLNAPVPEPIFTSTDRAYPTFNLGIPDQYRYEEFARDFGAVLKSGTVPALVVIRLPNDHTASPRPGDGYPDVSSYVADNDLALGRIVQLVSHSDIWKDSALLVAEDDAQGNVDHVDAHRSVMLAISPWVKPGMVSHRHVSMGSLQKTAYELLGLGPLNLEDALAADLGDMFTTTPDLRPFTALPEDKRIFDPARARLARPRNAEQARELQDMDDPEEIEAGLHARVRPRKAAR